MLFALGAAGVTLAVVLGIIGLPAVNACSADPRGVVTCLRDMADRKFGLPGTIPKQVAEIVPAEAPVPPPPRVVAQSEVTASGGPLEAPAVESAAVSGPSANPSAETRPAEAPAEAAPVAPQSALVAPASVETAAALEPRRAIEPVPPEADTPPVAPEPAGLDDTAPTWSTRSAPEPAPAKIEEPTDKMVAPATQVEPALPVLATQPEADTRLAVAPQPEPAAPPAGSQPQAPLAVTNAEPVASQPPAPTVAAPVFLAPTIDAIELDGDRSFVSGSGPAGALMRLYADGELIGESPVGEGRWLIEGNNLLDGPRRELRVEAIEPDTGKLLGIAAITIEIELPDGNATPDERPEEAPDLGSGVAPSPKPGPALPTLATAPPAAAPPPELADKEPPAAAAVPEAAPAPEPMPAIGPTPTEPETPQSGGAAVEPEVETLPPLARVVPERESASVEILGPSTLEPTTLPPAGDGADYPSTIAVPPADAPALIAEFDVRVPEPKAPGQTVTILRLLPFGDPDEGRYNVGKAIIRHGDTLWSIARRYYGHGIHYRTIFHANRELIRHPWRIFPGQIFDLPLVTDD